MVPTLGAEDPNLPHITSIAFPVLVEQFKVFQKLEDHPEASIFWRNILNTFSNILVYAGMVLTLAIVFTVHRA
jgi:hypothetical protein